MTATTLRALHYAVDNRRQSMQLSSSSSPSVPPSTSLRFIKSISCPEMQSTQMSKSSPFTTKSMRNSTPPIRKTKLQPLCERVIQPQHVVTEETMKTPSTPQLERETSDEEPVETVNKPLIFRDAPRLAMPSLDEIDEDQMMLKRANPVFDSDDEDDLFFSPPKRRRTNESANFTITWGDRVSFNGGAESEFRLQFSS
mmetsp:Transcript_19062/g.54159  ORF Transcript_19062/g.54159 Transcript_19062/m.54159 type:complete len:198 (+) Transcript_19062:164-757(+)|eukprot:CAMPEP_0119554804 /NCGR_PEP_ID=MMETSP1352-20130426/7182_1 /TAXON_ID=265584 /ORGANISM="Stauroneis constricta, Strain CCMP1120" /LENGTH=197 /DNA_ID=CAMNT_0007601447 /DNA_START=158 /DNA_END=751 /DNA_ORIENTATION=+